MRRVITYGTFDLLHYGHINLLRRAKEQGDYLIVALSTDEFNWNEKRKKSLDSMSKLFFIIPPSATSCTHRLTCRFGRCFCTLCRGLHRRPAPFTREAKG